MRRPATRRTASVEPTSEIVTRQTRRSARRPEASIEPTSKPETQFPQRGTRRSRRRSLESVATNDFTKDSPENASPGPEDRGLSPVVEPPLSHPSPISESEDGHALPEIDPARIQDLLDFDIPKLMRWSGKMYDILSSIGDDQLATIDQSGFPSTAKAYNAARRALTEDNALFITPISLPEDYDPEVQAKIQVATCSGNLITLLASMVEIMSGGKGPPSFFEQLDGVFPASFIAETQTDREDIDTRLELAFYIRCRHFMEALEADYSAKPLMLASKIFGRKSAHQAKNPREVLQNGPLKRLAGINVENDVSYTTFQAVMQKLVSKLSSNDRVEVLSSLDQKYSLAQLYEDLKPWALETYRQLGKPKDQPIHETQETDARANRAQSESLFVNTNNEEESDSDSASDADEEEYIQLAPQEANQSFIDNPNTLAAVIQSEKTIGGRTTTGASSSQTAAKGKEKAIDTINAIRSLEPELVLSGTRKRQRPDESSADEDEDDDFEVHEQLLNDFKQTRRGGSTTKRPLPKRPRFSRQQQTGSSQPSSPPVASNRETIGRQSVGNLPEDPNLQEQDILVLSQVARRNRRANQANKQPQIRTPWSAVDTSRLVDLIADPDLCCSWSKMEKANVFEVRRSQQQIRDKARGLKVWYLEGDRILPAGFDQVALGQKEKEAVIRCGKNPGRLEDDLDEDGHVINNVWDG